MPTKPILLSILLALLCGCQTYPMGHTKDQWESLTPEQQAEYRSQQAIVDEQNRIAAERQRLIDEQQRQIDAARQEQERARAAELERLEQARLQAAYRRARYGDIVTITIQGGTVDFAGTGRDYEPVIFDLLKGETKPVEFFQKGRPSNKITVPMRLSPDGHTFYMDNERARDRIVLIDDNWQRGRTYNNVEVTDHSSTSRARGITIKIVWKELPGAPARPIPERPPPGKR